MLITDLPLPATVKNFYGWDKITALYPPQIEVVEKGLFTKKNLLIAIPTASGKTLMAEMAMLKAILEEHGKALYIVPLKALASEKYERFSMFSECGLRIPPVTTAISTGDFKSKSEQLVESDIIVVTSEKADSLIRNRAEWLSQISIVVIDEIHLVGDPDRGATLEMVVAKMKRINPFVRLIGLSATIGNPEQLARWLKAELIQSDWRPTKLTEGVFVDGQILFEDSRKEVKVKHKDESSALALDMVLEGGQALVFCATRKIAESKAKKIAPYLKSYLDSPTKDRLETKAISSIDEDSKTSHSLAACISGGAAFHHAGLTDKLRAAVESGFRDGLIKVLFCTPTLAAGINLPARRVIIQGYKRYTVNGWEDIRVLEYKQMAGRAGRPRLDPYGEAILVPSGARDDEADRIAQKYIKGTAEKIYSSFAGIKPLRIHMLSSVASGFVKSVEEFNELLKETFLPYIVTVGGFYDQKSIDNIVIDTRKYLVDEGMILMDEAGQLTPTQAGAIISRLCLDPKTGAILIRGLDEIAFRGMEATNITLLHLVGVTADMHADWFYKDSDQEITLQVKQAHELELLRLEELIEQNQLLSEDIFESVKVVDILRMWITEVKVPLIAEAWNLGEGDVHTVIEQSKRIVSALYQIAALKGNDHDTKLARVLTVRLSKGIKQELIGLTKIKGIGRIFARRLYDAGINSEAKYDAVKLETPELLHRIMYPPQTQLSIRAISEDTEPKKKRRTKGEQK